MTIHGTQTIEITEDVSGVTHSVDLKTITCTWFVDPGHEWLRVSLETLEDFGLVPSDFSMFSYTDRENLYLEGDCDAGIFIRAVGESAELIFEERQCTAKFNVRNLPNNAT